MQGLVIERDYVHNCIDIDGYALAYTLNMADIVSCRLQVCLTPLKKTAAFALPFAVSKKTLYDPFTTRKKHGYDISRSSQSLHATLVGTSPNRTWRN